MNPVTAGVRVIIAFQDPSSLKMEDGGSGNAAGEGPKEMEHASKLTAQKVKFINVKVHSKVAELHARKCRVIRPLM